VVSRRAGSAPGSLPVPESLSVVVATFGRPESLERCLRAVAVQTRTADQIVVVFRLDDPPTRERLERLAREMPIEPIGCEQPRLCAQLDLGVASATGDVVALTDDDAEPSVSWAQRLLCLYADSDVGAAGGRDVLAGPEADGEPTDLPVGVVTRGGRPLGNHHRQGSGVRDVEFLKGVNLSIRRELWHIDQGLIGSGNQTHWELGTCLRIRRLGWRVRYDPGIVVHHEPGVRAGEPPRGSRERFVLERDAHNELYELVRWLPRWQAAAAVARASLVGSRELPGIGAAVWLAAHGLPPRRVFGELRASSVGRLRALRARPRRDRWAPGS
jgi:cellulose synthase/poly-beta-1,6-N-acetylglucosamine synthase-like glycosyltransferase